MKIIYGALILLLLFGGKLLLWPAVDTAVALPDLPVVTVDQVSIGGTTLTVEELYPIESGLAVVVTLVNEPGCDPRIMMPWYVTDQEGNTYPSSYTEHRNVLDEQGEIRETHRHLTVHFPTYAGDGQNIALQARIKHEHWQVQQDHETALDFIFKDVPVDGAYLAQSNKGLTIEASTKREAGASFIDMKLVAVDAQLWQALRQPQLKVVDEEGHEYVPVMSKSATEPVTPGGSPAATTVYWHYVLADWPVEAEHFDLYYELSGSIALPEEVTADFSGLHINIVEEG